MRRSSLHARLRPFAFVALLLAGLARDARVPTASALPPLVPTAVTTVGMTVADMDRSVAFYRDVLGFAVAADVEVIGDAYERLHGVFGARARVVRLRLGGESLELTEYLAPRGRPVPADAAPDDRSFQHVAIIVSDMDAAYARLRAAKVPHASTGPQTLPAWNPAAGGIKAFYFRDPDGHFLELLWFPPGKGEAKWQARDRGLFLGLDHTAIVTADTDASLAFYRDTLGLRVAGTSENHGPEQERLNNVFGARLRITALRAPAGPGVELLEYLAPRSGRPMPPDTRANDLWHWQTTIAVADRLATLVRHGAWALVSPGAISVPDDRLGFREGLLVRDPDGHGVRVVTAAE
jgi:catechol 2,3-dioxygenase-like lactoylglutathione lyase family enzyme